MSSETIAPKQQGDHWRRLLLLVMGLILIALGVSWQFKLPPLRQSATA